MKKLHFELRFDTKFIATQDMRSNYIYALYVQEKNLNIYLTIHTKVEEDFR